MPYKPFKLPQPKDREIIPSYKCFCCHDTGLVAVPQDLPGGEHYQSTDPSVLCVRPYCQGADTYYGGLSGISAALQEGRVADCATAQECQDLHDRELADWHSTARNKIAQINAALDSNFFAL
ncbi:MAG: hypothetical protein DDT26_01509 [Dehalococcoidia bacterium]|nr:hypothetical protein [Chloroflexota bacterium]